MVQPLAHMPIPSRKALKTSNYNDLFDEIFGTNIFKIPDTYKPIKFNNMQENIGKKNDEGKIQWWYLPIEPIKETLKVLAYGDKKYPAQDGANWKRVPDAKKRYYSALMRHVTSWYNGERNDPETGLHHLAHACSNVLFLLWFELQDKEEKQNNYDELDF